MKVFNKTKNLIVVDNITIASTIAQKITGLIGKNSPSSLFIRTHWGIHTFGMKFPIDCLVLDNNGIVKSFYKNMSPNRVFIWLPIYSRVLELPQNSIEKGRINLGDCLEIV
ncbi:MAG TPA: DUF192 domain-containing protein [Candidatus Paceibacterota bacterium]|nr:DUF192 domain-containing protein [Candidatus Paceibacterota bacterium]